MRTPRFALSAALALLAAGLSPAPARAQGVKDLNRAIEDYNRGAYSDAALTFFDVAENSGEPELSWRAEYFLTLSLFKMGLFHSALYYDRLVIDQGANHPYYLKAVENTLDVMESIGDKALIPNLLDKEYNEKFAGLPPAVINRINFLVALRGNRKGAIDDSIDFLKSVPKDAASYPRARYLRGVQLANQSLRSPDRKRLEDEAAAAFDEVIALKPTEKAPYPGLDEVKPLATLALARLRYQQGAAEPKRYSEATALYEKIPQFSRWWRDALFEGAYAAFMNGDTLPGDAGRALGMLHTLHAPMAGDQLVPESWLLKAEIYYFSCLWDESKAALAVMQRNYGEIASQVKALLEAKREPEFYWALMVEGGRSGTALPAAVRNELLTDDWLHGYRAYVDALAAESTKLKGIGSWQKSLLSKVLVEAVEQQRNLLVQTGGRQVQREMKRVVNQLDEIDGQAEIVKFEMAKREKDLLETGYEQESLLRGQTLYRPSAALGAEYWDFDGEYWPDELGFYRYTVKNACPAEPERAAER